MCSHWILSRALNFSRGNNSLNFKTMSFVLNPSLILFKILWTRSPSNHGTKSQTCNSGNSSKSFTNVRKFLWSLTEHFKLLEDAQIPKELLIPLTTPANGSQNVFRSTHIHIFFSHDFLLFSQLADCMNMNTTN